jgi:hypothetical protein
LAVDDRIGRELTVMLLTGIALWPPGPPLDTPQPSPTGRRILLNQDIC